MGTAYPTAVGNPPNIIEDYAGWLAWYFRLLTFRIAECPSARTTTYYFSQSGNDATGDGSLATPWKTLAKAQSTHDASSGDIRLRFKRGDVWEETTGLAISKTGVTVDAYGSGNKPLFNRFTLKYSSGWTVATGDRYTRSEANDIAWVRDTSDRLGIVYTRVTSTALVESTALSFYYDASGDVLHINSGSGVDPNDEDLEAVISNSVSGVNVSGDGCRVQNIRGDGWGCHRTTTGTQAEGVKSTAGNANANVFVSCEGYYSSSHAMAHLRATGTGGIATFVRCKAGYTKYAASAGETVFNSFAAEGGHETILHECEAPYGTLPSSDWYGGTASAIVRARPYYGHTSSGEASLYIAYKFRTPDSAYGCHTPGQWVNPATAATAADVRTFMVHDDFGQSRIGCEFTSFAGASAIRYAPKIRLTAGNWSQRSLTNDVQRGWLVNGDIELNLAAFSGSTSSIGLWNSTSGGHDIQIVNSRLKITPSPNAGLRLPDFDSGTSSDGVKFVNAIIDIDALTTGSAVLFGISGDADHFANCAFYGPLAASAVTGGDQVQLLDATDEGVAPDPTSLLYQAGSDEILLSHDINGHPRNPALPSIGPVSDFVPTFRPRN